MQHTEVAAAVAVAAAASAAICVRYGELVCCNKETERETARGTMNQIFNTNLGSYVASTPQPL